MKMFLLKKGLIRSFIVLLFVFVLLVFSLLPFFFIYLFEYLYFFFKQVLDIISWFYLVIQIKVRGMWLFFVEFYLDFFYQSKAARKSESYTKFLHNVYSVFVETPFLSFIDFMIVWGIWTYFNSRSLLEDTVIDNYENTDEILVEGTEEHFEDKQMDDSHMFGDLEDAELLYPDESLEDSIIGEQDLDLEDDTDENDLYSEVDHSEVGPDDDTVFGQYAPYQHDIFLYGVDFLDGAQERVREGAVDSSAFLSQEKGELLENDSIYEEFDEEFGFAFPEPSLLEKSFWDVELPEELILVRFGWEPSLFDQEIFVYFRQSVFFCLVRFFFNFLPLFVIEIFFLQQNVSRVFFKVPVFHSCLYLFFLCIEIVSRIFCYKKFSIFFFLFFFLFLLLFFFNFF